ncbi:serine phosphatase RsbU (regulator of sigma subunit) [Sediminihabitans luteus]|uniref:Serine phosphatase RsbU (Regulator of sigma subunit) n=1 Tax=Sediminihabitans luteus TaxID=1138585 RepID=A0A2M9D0S5_9CELL|nr:SpoIIE family protein phosphatase [Sediminihabitans luteus]PJJ77796.1 serine phosphatase RsbU (regulator of sigma subunit) [Sediminihabitans luteus]GII99846.1 hypothetical protein Slu03_22240 [Sediminihabitans luteus]
MTRVEAVRDLVEAGLDSAAPDPSFDRFARLVRRHLGTPLAAVVIVLDDADVFPGALGLNDTLQRERRLQGHRSLARIVVEDGAPLVIDDITRDARARVATTVALLGVGAFVGYPIHDLRGRPVGALCAADTASRVWSAEDRAALADLAAACTAELGMRAERERARRIQHVAVRANRKSRALLMLSEAFADAGSVSDVEETLSRVAMAGLGARWTGLALLDADGKSLAYASNTFLPPGEAAAALVTPLDAESPLTQAARTGELCQFHDAASVLRAFPGASIDACTGARVVLPLHSGRRLVGVVCVVWGAAHETDDDERSVELALARYTVQALDRVRLLEDRRAVATTLQAAMLTKLPAVAGLELASTYSPAARSDQVGGDWYDAVVLDDDAAVLMIGDVTGHDMRAAAVMGQLRSMLRTFAWSQDESPATLLRLLDRANTGLGLDATGTAVVARLDRRNDPARPGHVLTWSSAGHIAPVVLRADGTAEILSGAPDFMLGVAPGSDRADHTAWLSPGDTLVLFTDGLVEQRAALTGVDVDALVQAAAAYGDGSTAALPDALVRRLVGERQRDDVAVLAVRVRHGAATRPATNADPVARSRDVGPGRASAGNARRWVDDLLESCGVASRLRRDAMLLTSELVTNALHHGELPVRLGVRVDDDQVRVAVADASPEHPVLQDPSPYAGGGRGMQLVARFSSAWGVEPADDGGPGKSVWFTLARELPVPRRVRPVAHRVGGRA